MENPIASGFKRPNDVVLEERECSERACGRSTRICLEEPATNEDGQTPLHILCQDRCCSVEDVENMIAAFPGALHRRDVYGRSVSPPWIQMTERKDETGVSLFALFSHSFTLSNALVPSRSSKFCSIPFPTRFCSRIFVATRHCTYFITPVRTIGSWNMF